MKTRKLTISRRGLLGASAGLAAGAGLGGAVGRPDPALADTASTAPALTAAAAIPPAAIPPASVVIAEAAIAKHTDAILRLSREVWAWAELSLAEVKSAAAHLRELTVAGFKTTSSGTSGFPAAFIVEWTQGTGGPILGFLPEYDALPDLGNTADPQQKPTANGNTNGHGCGHNALGAGCTGGAIALKTMMQDMGTPGTVRVYGCSAEETEGVKVHMARDGVFNDLDAALAWHPAPVAVTGEVMTAAIASFQVRFHGRTAHAGNTPWDGRSALKGAELFGAGIQYMREHVPTTARMHYIYEVAGSTRSPEPPPM